MSIDRRRFLEVAALSAGAVTTACSRTSADDTVQDSASSTPTAIAALNPMTDGIVPISRDERLGRIAKAQELMAEQRLDAVFLEGTASCFYYTGTRWGQSERTFGVVIPAIGELAWVCPKFEEERAHELITFGTEVRTWEEDESPYALIAGIVRDRGARHGRIGIEERVRFFIADGIRQAAIETSIK